MEGRKSITDFEASDLISSGYILHCENDLAERAYDFLSSVREATFMAGYRGGDNIGRYIVCYLQGGQATVA